MSNRELGIIGEAVLGSPGVLLMVVLWCFAVGCAMLPPRFGKSPGYSLPALGVAIVLAALPPAFIGVFWFLIIATLFVMVPALWLIALEESTNRRRGAALITASGLVLAVGPSLPDGFIWLTIPLWPVMMFGIPVGMLLLTQRTLRSRTWLPAIVSSLAFVAAWSVW
jgi:hypothetical protein